MKRSQGPDVERTLFRPAELADRWGLDRSTIYRMADDGRLKVVPTPFGLRIHQDEILRVECSGAGTPRHCADETRAVRSESYQRRREAVLER